MIGELRNRIKIQKLESTINENGFSIIEWKDYKTVWAKVLNLTGKEFFEAKKVNGESTVKFIIRYTAGLTEEMRIVFKDKVYDITHISNIKYENKYIEIKGVAKN